MKTADLDVVYTLKESGFGDELKYSLRSLKNFPHRKVFIFGGCPDWVKDVEWVKAEQNQRNKWRNTAWLLKAICENENVSENFVWFNDDFFVLKPIEDLPYYYDRTLTARTNDFRKVLGYYMSGYCNRLLTASRELGFKKKENKNYELHIPFVFNREKLKQIIDKHPNIGAKRSLYGNYFANEKSIQREDVKIYNNTDIPGDDWDFVSTSDNSFASGEVGKWIKKKFNRKCKYEK